VRRLAEAIRGNACPAGGPARRLSDAEAYRHAREVLDELLSQPVDDYPIQEERLGLRFYVQWNTMVGGGTDELSVNVWEDGMWRTVFRADLPPDLRPGSPSDRARRKAAGSRRSGQSQ